MRKRVCGSVAPCGMSAVLLRAIVSLISLALILVPFAAFAHSGGTDDYGGHIVKKTGAYHFHHGHSAHSHKNGVCPYGDYEEFLNSEGFDVEQLDTLYVNRDGVPYDTIIAYIAPSSAPKPSPAPTASPSPSPSPTACSTPTLNPTVFASPSPSTAVKSAGIAGASPYPMLVVVITALPSQLPTQDSYTVPAPTANAAVIETPAPDLSLHVDGTSITFSFDWANMLYIFLGLAVVFIFVRAVKRWSKR